MPKQQAPVGERPFHEIRHRSVRATIWKNETSKGPMYNVTVSRRYRDGEEWKDSRSFGFSDLMNLAKILFDAHTFIADQEAKDRKATSKASARTGGKMAKGRTAQANSAPVEKGGADGDLPL